MCFFSPSGKNEFLRAMQKMSVEFTNCSMDPYAGTRAGGVAVGFVRVDGIPYAFAIYLGTITLYSGYCEISDGCLCDRVLAAWRERFLRA